ncbi:MAG: 4-hydroxy-tetrahydrodipicolinate synthase [Deltaproteobacteria bacterium]|nr:4-hydroxy-tetrahydrodipicolinate synthase [Deltaproteobacteria bacterium]
MTMRELKGMIVPNITPFKNDAARSLDLERIDKLVDFIIDKQNADAIIAVGTTGESTSLSHDEKEVVILRTLKAVKERVPVLAATGSANTQEAIAMTQFCERSGIAGVLLVSPYYIRPNQDGLYQHFSAVAQNTKLPIILYNHPGRTGVSIQVDTLIRLAQRYENIIGIKDCPNNLALSTDVARRCRSELGRSFSFLTGEDEFIYMNICLGGDGAIAASGHLLGNEIKQMIDLFNKGQVEQARKLQFMITDLIRMLFVMPSPAPLKAALDILTEGEELGGPVRLPLVDAPEDLKQKLKIELARVKG